MKSSNERTTWNYRAITRLDRAVQFITMFLLALFVMSLLARFALWVL